MLRKLGALAALTAASAAVVFVVLPTQKAPALDGGASRTWVSGVGDDANPCSRTAPCKTFAGAISKTASYGTINCLDPGGFGAVTITKSITIDCHEVYGSSLVAGTNAIIINFDAFAGDDVEKTVRLRNLNIQSVHNGLDGIKILGAVTGSTVQIEDCMIDGFQGSNPSVGIHDVRSGGGYLDVQNTTIRNIRSTGANSAAGIQVTPSSGSTRINVSVDHVHAERAGWGLRASDGVRADVTNSFFTGNPAGGVLAEGSSNVNLDHVVSSNNTVGLQTSSPAALRIADTDILFNNTAITGAVGTYGTNRIFGNTAAGTSPTNIGAASSANGQQ